MTEKNAAAEQRAGLLTALAAQQQVIETQATQLGNVWLGLELIARYAGLSDRIADIKNPASPVADPASAAPSESTEQALESATHDNVENLGSTPGANEGVPAKMTTTPMTPGESIPTKPYTDLIDVTAPVSGTETHIPEDQTRIETDVRVGDPDNPEKAFPWTLKGGDKGAKEPGSRHGANRTFASLKLAKLRMVAGVEQGEELEIAGRIEADAALSDDMIGHETKILSAIRSTANRNTPRNLVPRTAGAERTNPSLAAPNLGQTVAGVDSDDTQDSDLFD